MVRRECLVLLGLSGCGKSTLLNVLAADGGRLTCDGVPLDDAAARLHLPMHRPATAGRAGTDATAVPL